MSRAMQSMWVSLKSGSWLTPERLRLYPALLLDFEAVAILVLVVTSDGRHDFIAVGALTHSARSLDIGLDLP